MMVPASCAEAEESSEFPAFPLPASVPPALPALLPPQAHSAVMMQAHKNRAHIFLNNPVMFLHAAKSLAVYPVSLFCGVFFPIRYSSYRRHLICRGIRRYTSESADRRLQAISMSLNVDLSEHSSLLTRKVSIRHQAPGQGIKQASAQK
jgi:hypothetical protein